MKLLHFQALLIFCISTLCNAQFSPPAGESGSIAVHVSDSRIKGWAKTCKVTRGYRDISKPDSGFASAGTDTMATGPAMQNGVVSLGDKGQALLTLPYTLANGPGYDFAVYENSFLDSFLELAFVEVSSDGKRFVRFPAISLTDTIAQTGPFGYLNCRKLNNLAGSFRVGYGTPFDLEELKDSAGLDLNHIQYLRIIDVCGSLDPKYRSTDSKGAPVNDPWPTNFASSGFDLDAVALLQDNPLKTQSSVITQGNFYPNPQQTGLAFFTHLNLSGFTIHCFNATGQQINIKHSLNALYLPENTTGLFCVVMSKGNETYRETLIVKP